MKFYEESKTGNSRSKNSCSYCGKSDHNASHCEQAVIDHKQWKEGLVPKNSTVSSWIQYPSNYGRWYDAAEKAYNMYQKRLVREVNKTKKKRSASRCGFCRGEDHNRRECTAMAAFLQDCYTANQNWRRAFHQRLITELGIWIGAVVQVDVAQKSYWSSKDHKPDIKVGLVTGINIDDLSFLSSDRAIDDKYRTDHRIDLLIDGEKHALHINDVDDGYSKTGLVNKSNNQLLASPNRWYSRPATYIKTIARSEKEITDEWVRSGHIEEFKYLVQKRSLEQLKEHLIYRTVQNWL